MARDVVRSLNSRSGMIGSTATFASTYSAAAMISTPAVTSTAVIGDTQANCWPASETQISSTLTPPVISAAPR